MSQLLGDAGSARIRRTVLAQQRSVLATSGLGLLAAAVTCMTARAEWHGEAIDLMGTRVSVELWHEDEATGRRLVERILDEYRRIDADMSTYKPDSEISRLNARAALAPVAVSMELQGLIWSSLYLSSVSGGAFDITYESVGYLYDFRARRHPGDAQIDAGLGSIDYRHVELDQAAGTIRYRQPGVRINLGGIAKGHAVERAAKILSAAGIEHALLSAGGDTRVIGDRRGQPWIVGIRHPRVDDAVITRLPLVDEAISTSGDYERFFEENGKRYHHILNPATGRPTEGMLSVTVIGPDAKLTDGLSTTLFVLGPERGLALIESFDGYEAIVVDAVGAMRYSSGLTPPDAPDL